MKNMKFAVGLFMIGAIVASSQAFAIKPGEVTNPNGFLNGPHYNLNILGKKDGWTPDLTASASEDGNALFVRLNGTTKIMMSQSTDGTFAVTDPNGLDGTAGFVLAPGHYNVFARSLAKPGGTATVSASGTFTDAVDGDTLIPLGYVEVARSKGKSKAMNINELLYVDVTLCTAIDPITLACTEETTYEDTWVFDVAELVDYAWDYENTGLKLLQVRFYPCTTDATNTSLNRCIWADGTPIVPTKTITSLLAF